MPASERRSVYLIETYWLPRTPFCLSSGKLGLVDLAPSLRDQGEDLAGDVTFEDADDLKFGMALGRPLGHVGFGSRIRPQPPDGDHVQCTVCRSVAAPVETMTGRLAGGRWDRTDATQGGKARLGLQSFRIVSRSQQELCRSAMANRVPRHEIGCEFIDDGVDHDVEIGNLVMQFEIPPAQGFQRDPVGGGHLAEIGEIWPPRRQRPDELHAGHVAQRLPQVVWRADDGVVDHLQGDAPCRHGRLPTSLEDAQGLDHAVPSFGRDRALAGEGGMRSILRVEIVVLSAPPPIVLVRRRDLQDLDPGLLDKTKQTGAIAAGRLDPDALDLPKRSHPGKHLPITLAGRGKASGFQNTILFINDRSDMQILMGVHAPDDATPGAFFHVHSEPPGSSVLRRLRPERMHGQDSHVTMRSGPSWVTGIGEAKPHRKAVPGGRQVRGKTRLTVDRSAGQAAPGRLAAPAYQTVYRCESQAAREQLARTFLLSLWCTSRPRWTRRRAWSACSSASRTKPAVAVRLARQPTILRA